MVFRTLRLGFPSATVCVYLNGWHNVHEDVLNQAKQVGAILVPAKRTTHDAWVKERLLTEKDGNHVICDTDMVFFRSIENWEFDHPFAGDLEPTHRNPVTAARHWERLHTSLLFFRPSDLRKWILLWKAKRPNVNCPQDPDLVSQQWLPSPEGLQFADTACLLYQAISGEEFTTEQREAYTHLHCGTWSDIVEDDIPGLQESHAKAVADPQSARGLWRQYDRWYQEHAD
jgi:hypothetical protein